MGDGKPSLRPPLHGYYRSEADAPRTSWALLDLYAYIADRENYTSAYCKMSDGTQIRVTFCAAPPPLVSYVCVWCPEKKPTEVVLEPRILAVSSDLLLLQAELHGWSAADYFVYKAYDGSGPSLQLIQLPEPCLNKRCTFALLPRRDVRPPVECDDGEFRLRPCTVRPPVESDDDGGFVLRPCTGRLHGEDDGTRFRLRRHWYHDRHYYVAGFYYDRRSEPDYSFKLWVFDSQVQRWTSRLISVQCPVDHITTKAIALGEGGLLGFVDMWRGIVVCDILDRTSPRYIPLPTEIIVTRMTFDDPGLLFRDIAVVEGRLTVVYMAKEGPNLEWEVSTWSRKVTDDWDEDWRHDHTVSSKDIVVDYQRTHNVDLLPICQATSRPTLVGLYTGHPTLSLRDSHVVYIMAKVSRKDRKALVLSIDMKMPTLYGVAVFDGERMRGLIFSYTLTQCWIPKYFNPGDSSFLYLHMANLRYSHSHVVPLDECIWCQTFCGSCATYSLLYYFCRVFWVCANSLCCFAVHRC